MRAISMLALLTLGAALAADETAVEPKDFAARVAAGAQPAVLQVGIAYLYRADHIPGSIYAGPAGRPAGLDLLKTEASKLPRDREVVIYCGCCPWDKCPNMRPAIELLKSIGFTHVTVMHIPTSFKADWVDKGYAVEHGEAAK